MTLTNTTSCQQAIRWHVILCRWPVERLWSPVSAVGAPSDMRPLVSSPLMGRTSSAITSPTTTPNSLGVPMTSTPFSTTSARIWWERRGWRVRTWTCRIPRPRTVWSMRPSTRSTRSTSWCVTRPCQAATVRWVRWTRPTWTDTGRWTPGRRSCWPRHSRGIIGQAPPDRSCS